jgi:hypothetical protein
VQLGFDKNTVQAGIKELEKAGHVVVRGSGQVRRIYHLKSPIFGQ